MRLLFAFKQFNYSVHYRPTLVALAERGHHVDIRWPKSEGVKLPESLEGVPNITVGSFPHKRSDEWAAHVPLLRGTRDYVRYLQEPFRGATKLRRRAFDRLLSRIVVDGTDPAWDAEAMLAVPATEAARLDTLFAAMEGLIPHDPSLDVFLQHARPDLVILSPLIDLGSSMTDMVKSARAAGIPSAQLLFSWDNFSTKGCLHEIPDWIFVWNEQQREEAVALHGVPRERIVITGACRFDDFFARSPATTRQEFCVPLGLDVDRPIVTYVCSSPLVSGAEWDFVRDWRDAIRRSADPLLRNANLLIRPHPVAQPESLNGRTVVPLKVGKTGSFDVVRPFEDPGTVVAFAKRSGYYDTLYHSAAVVGLNTSAEIEAAMLGRPVLTVVADHPAIDGQASTLHFHYIVDRQGGFVRLAESLDEHASQLAAALVEPIRNEPLPAVARFVRPVDWTRPAGLVLADAIEAVASGRMRAQV